jgi:hypothetical protein
MFDEDLLEADGESEERDDLMGEVPAIELDGVVRPGAPLTRWFRLQVPDEFVLEQPSEVELELAVSEEAPKRAGERGNGKEAPRTERRDSGQARLSTFGGKVESNTMTDDHRRMVLVGHFGRLRHA